MVIVCKAVGKAGALEVLSTIVGASPPLSSSSSPPLLTTSVLEDDNVSTWMPMLLLSTSIGEVDLGISRSSYISWMVSSPP